MQPKIKSIKPKKLVGMHRSMSLIDDSSPLLWRQFMPRRHEVKHRAGNEYFSMQAYSGVANELFSPQLPFEKWAVVEVLVDDDIPAGMERYFLSGGKYAVFIHHGPASTFPQTMQYIFGEWLPNSEYELDGREHFEVLPEGYDPFDQQAQEEVWVPIK